MIPRMNQGQFGMNPMMGGTMNPMQGGQQGGNSLNAMGGYSMPGQDAMMGMFNQMNQVMMALMTKMMESQMAAMSQSSPGFGGSGGGGGGTPGVGSFLGGGSGGGGGSSVGGGGGGASSVGGSSAPSVDIGEIGQGTEFGKKLAEDAGKNATGPGGLCYKYVAQALARAGVSVSGASAYMAADQLAKSDKFREVKIDQKDFKKLPAGAVVVWDRGNGHEHGHISIALGNGKEASDKLRDQITNYGTAPRVFLPK